jgi:hypothetical protein
LYDHPLWRIHKSRVQPSGAANLPGVWACHRNNTGLQIFTLYVAQLLGHL